jgi:GNAT superfamily N-acetyltransferase
VALRVEVVESVRLAGVRSRALRDGKEHVGFAEDDDPQTLHVAALEDDVVVGVATFIPQDAGVWQLRGMGVEPERQGEGIGSVLLAEAEARLRTLGARSVWANGRDVALAFYERAGWRVEGEGYELIGLAHHRVVRDL